MKRILLLSDTHGYLDEQILSFAQQADEIWHAGDFGNYQLALQLHTIKPLKGVFGNIDGNDIRSQFQEQSLFMCEDVKVLIKHIGGYPGKYAPGIKDIINREKVNLFVSGHSHILKIIFDEKLNCLHMNPGAAGKQGWQKVRTLIRFAIDGNNIKDCEVIHL